MGLSTNSTADRTKSFKDTIFSMTELTLAGWNNFLEEHPSVHLLQSGEWGELKSTFGWTPERVVSGSSGAQILFRQLPLGFTLAYIPKGPVSVQEAGLDDDQFWKEVDDLCRRRKAIFLKVETNQWVSHLDQEPAFPPAGFLLSPQHIQPRSTLVIDLRGSEDEVFNLMKPKTRYNIRLAGRKEVIVHPSNDLDHFYKVMTVTGRRENFHVHSLDYYCRAYQLFHPKGMCELFMAEFQDQTLATLMVFRQGKQAYYLYGASSDQERNRKATYPLQWEAIRWAHSRGCLEYDMWGIPDDAIEVEEDESEAREDGLWGVYRFKRGFGGSIKRAMPTLDRVYNPLLYRLYLWRFSGSGAD
jgi:peptidoglycan pentaglycine glycine transferase (the first glycine)